MSDPCGEPITSDHFTKHCYNDATHTIDGVTWRCEWCHRREQERAILRDLINGMRAAAEMTEGSVHARYMEKACDVAEARMKKVTP